MPYFSKTSKERLSTAHKDLQVLFNEVIKYFDCTIIYGHRTPEEQFGLFKTGRELVDGEWIVRGDIVTNTDGYNKLSKHNECPSLAVDVVPYPVDWDDESRMDYFGGFVLGIATMLRKQGKITSDIRWGNDWDGDTYVNDTRMIDRPHFQIN